MSAVPWGGSEELWSRAAEAALTEHHAVLASVTEWDHLNARLARLVQQGMAVHLRKHYSPEILVRVLRRVQSKVGLAKPLEKAMDAFKPDFVCISQGGNFDMVHMAWFRRYLFRNNLVFYIVCHNYNPNVQLNDAERGIAVELFGRARRVFFVSTEQRNVTQRQLAHRITNAEVVKNPINLFSEQLVPWPAASVPAFAIVAGLHVERKGHDIALDVLSQPKWQARAWHLNLYGDGPDRKYIEDLIAMYGLGGRVTVHGNVDNIRGVWEVNHLMLLPSPSRSQGMGAPAGAVPPGPATLRMTPGRPLQPIS